MKRARHGCRALSFICVQPDGWIDVPGKDARSEMCCPISRAHLIDDRYASDRLYPKGEDTVQGCRGAVWLDQAEIFDGVALTGQLGYRGVDLGA
jgi:hypothetical protein